MVPRNGPESSSLIIPESSHHAAKMDQYKGASVLEEVIDDLDDFTEARTGDQSRIPNKSNKSCQLEVAGLGHSGRGH